MSIKDLFKKTDIFPLEAIRATYHQNLNEDRLVSLANIAHPAEIRLTAANPVRIRPKQ